MFQKGKLLKYGLDHKRIKVCASYYAFTVRNYHILSSQLERHVERRGSLGNSCTLCPRSYFTLQNTGGQSSNRVPIFQMRRPGRNVIGIQSLGSPSMLFQERREISILTTTGKIIDGIRNRLKKIWRIMKNTKRPFNTDDISAFISWLLAGNVVLLIIGTTTFFSLLLYTLNTVLAQELVAEWIGNMITKNTKLTVTFENAIVPDWKDGKIQFKNCTVSRRPKNSGTFKKITANVEEVDGEKKHRMKSTLRKLERSLRWKKEKPKKSKNQTAEFDDGNYTQFDFTIDEVNISLSFKKWLNGKGIIKEASGKGVRGVVDRTHVVWKEGDSATNYRNVAQPGDWEIENFQVEDVLFKMMNPKGFRTFSVSVYKCEIPLLRKNWLMFDIMNAIHMSGSYDGSLFTMNRLQRFDSFNEEKRIDREVRRTLLGEKKYQDLSLVNDQNFSRVTRFRIDNLKLDHLNGGMSGPFGWINKGTVDMIADVIVPKKNISMDDISIDEIVKYYSKNLRGKARNKGDNLSSMNNMFILDFYLRLNNPRASVPLFSNNLSYVNIALIQPIVAYINSNKTYIPIRCRVYKDVEDFNGSWTLYDSLLMDDLSIGVYKSFADYVSDEQKRTDRVKKISIWSLQFLLQLILLSLSTLNS